jgi:class 3 adenylate cyclase
MTTHDVNFEVALPRERVWQVMADTQHLNQLFFGLGAGTVVGRDGEKARLRGTFGMFAPEYDEFPWSFEVPRAYKNRRVFVRGLLRVLETECVLDVVDDSTTRVRYLLNVEGQSGPFGALAVRVAVGRVKRGLVEVRAMLERMAKSAQQAALVQWPPANPQREAVQARADAVTVELAQKLEPRDRKILADLVAFIADATDADVARMRPYELADAWGQPRTAVLLVFLRAVRAGLLRLSWDVLCPACEGAQNVTSLKDLPVGGHCDACDIDFTTAYEENVEANFSPEPAVRRGERLVFCHGSPSSTKTWLAQFVVPPKSVYPLTLTLGQGRYRLQAPRIQRPALVDVLDAAGADVAEVVLAKSEGALTLPARIEALRAGSVTVQVKNDDDVPHRVQLAHRAFASKAATAADVTGLGLFRELFGKEVLSPDQHVGVGQMSILFTDLVGSTAMYERVGDAAAYGMVREHFKLLFAAIEGNNGRIVKTVGDCVMAAFDVPVDAVAAGHACIAALRTLRGADGGPSGLRLKVGVHTGSCLAVEANHAVDYFGRTVNIAARVESLAHPDELVVSWATMAAPDVKTFVDSLERNGATVSVDHKPVKGIVGDVEVVRVA